jgi:hypothetical protein
MGFMEITSRSVEFSPQAYARMGCLLYLFVIVTGIFAEMVVREPTIVTHDAAATANNILAHELLFRMGFVAEFISGLCNIPLVLIFYELFKIVNKRVTPAGGVFLASGDCHWKH